MARNTISDIREIVEYINDNTDLPLSFNCWGVGTNKYQLINDETGETYTPVCEGSTEFIKAIRSFRKGNRAVSDETPDCMKVDTEGKCTDVYVDGHMVASVSEYYGDVLLYKPRHDEPIYSGEL
jgi:hypothetical protein